MLQHSNKKHKIIIDYIATVLEQNNSTVYNAYFIHGLGGTWKTLVYKYLTNKCSKFGFELIAVAWTGMAATWFANVRTVHSHCKLPIKLNETSV